jgi:hypothetical protein
MFNLRFFIFLSLFGNLTNLCFGQEKYGFKVNSVIQGGITGNAEGLVLFDINFTEMELKFRIIPEYGELANGGKYNNIIFKLTKVSENTKVIGTSIFLKGIAIDADGNLYSFESNLYQDGNCFLSIPGLAFKLLGGNVQRMMFD